MYLCHDCTYFCHCCNIVILSINILFKFHARELDPYRTLAEAATVVHWEGEEQVRRRLSRRLTCRPTRGGRSSREIKSRRWEAWRPILHSEIMACRNISTDKDLLTNKTDSKRLWLRFQQDTAHKSNAQPTRKIKWKCKIAVAWFATETWPPGWELLGERIAEKARKKRGAHLPRVQIGPHSIFPEFFSLIWSACVNYRIWEITFTENFDITCNMR